MKMKRLIIWIISFACCYFVLVGSAGAENWKAAILVSNKARIVYGKNVNRRLPPASTVKVLTAMVVIDNLPLNKWVYIDKEVASIEPSKVYLLIGQYYKVRDLVYAMLMGSANDAALALAKAVSGSEVKFTRLLNIKAKRCGVTRSRFLTATGLPAKGQFTTVKDLAAIMRHAVRYRLIVSALSRKVYVFSSKSGKKIKVVNHNKLLWDKHWNWVRGKTGFTHLARQCFVGYFYKKNKLYVFSFLGARTLWNNVKELVRMAWR